jgi:hypothetical protein
MAQRERGIGTAAGKTADVNRGAVREGSEEGAANARRGSGCFGALPRSGFVVCRACSTAWGCKSPAQPDGGEVRAKRKGVAARRGLKEAWSEAAT